MVRNKTTLFKGRLGMKVTGAENRSATSSKDLDNLVRFFWNRILLIFQNEFLASNLLTLAEFLKHARI
jgi:hypothetical protein